MRSNDNFHIIAPGRISNGISQQTLLDPENLNDLVYIHSIRKIYGRS